MLHVYTSPWDVSLFRNICLHQEKSPDLYNSTINFHLDLQNLLLITCRAQRAPYRQIGKQSSSPEMWAKGCTRTREGPSQKLNMSLLLKAARWHIREPKRCVNQVEAEFHAGKAFLGSQVEGL